MEEYARRAAEPNKDETPKRALSNAAILAQINPENQTLAKDNWFRCELCNRRFKDSVKLADHIAGAQHAANLSKFKQENPQQAPTLESVKTHMRKLKTRLEREGWLEGLGFGGSTQERLLRQQEILEKAKAKKQRLA